MRQVVTKLNFLSFAIIGLLSQIAYSQEEEYQYEYDEEETSGEGEEYYYDTMYDDGLTRMMSDAYESEGLIDYGDTDYTINDELLFTDADLEGNVEYLQANNIDMIINTAHVLARLDEDDENDEFQDENLDQAQVNLDDVFRRRRRRRRKKRPRTPTCPTACHRRDKGCHLKKRLCDMKTKSVGWSAYRDGAKGLYERGILSGSGHHLLPAGCEGGYEGQCANGIRVGWLLGNPRKNWRRKELQFYISNPRYAKAEACLVFSGLAVPAYPAAIQKAMSNLRGGPPSYCGKNPTEECKAREEQFMACAGVRICANSCWSPVASRRDCDTCIHSYCRDSPYSSQSTKYYNLCLRARYCLKGYHPDRFSSVDIFVKRRGSGCWGQSLVPENQIDMNPLTGLNTNQICERNRKGRHGVYSTWEVYSDACLRLTCKEDGSPEENMLCDEARCTRTCANNGDAGSECIACRFGPRAEETKCEVLHSHFTAIVKPKLRQACIFPVLVTECRNACKAYGQALSGPNYVRDDPINVSNRDKCKSVGCQQKLGMACRNCLYIAEKYKNVQYTTGLGTSEYMKNTIGWGCQKDCSLKNYQALAKQNRNALSPEERDTCHKVDHCMGYWYLGAYDDVGPDVQYWCELYAKGKAPMCRA